MSSMDKHTPWSTFELFHLQEKVFCAHCPMGLLWLQKGSAPTPRVGTAWAKALWPHPHTRAVPTPVCPTKVPIYCLLCRPRRLVEFLSNTLSPHGSPRTCCCTAQLLGKRVIAGRTAILAKYFSSAVSGPYGWSFITLQSVVLPASFG